MGYPVITPEMEKMINDYFYKLEELAAYPPGSEPYIVVKASIDELSKQYEKAGKAANS